ncbi:tRNA uridine-5-carboxymethylaminomethyl(34) synthesis GTPase MnmE [Bergeyella cardium]|uniref:tRNA modification GTPase MnmE n=1 Tax=Bergeyella cardium TaxID=1585976 RepID=A0A6P1QU25_9FLAO|nr:tRNA uridine-5-carboxymethylaminomethyl(34) synthesis GTPase MnmE [Bergeyella cardium]QHN64687.1 tRNA uridine-5-carboxymethylaminomethyl(34) synthesis GTPase MnmE [Bergeyella cardium]WHE33989.1 tRNA uridine-5-carboxymethylaminomethyl(34) synthesis GTPase MnmE [Bergeyella cardium]WHF60639.1 tRNA uridine-5-carboxymethylaminomethyl(34) synthesis GTPase MnmE [Bergeyella cardium]
MNQDTICALATANGVGAIGIIRISGEDAVSITNKIFEGKDLEAVKTHTVHYGFIKDNDEVIDEVMVSVFYAPRTFTAENSVEISFHGSPHIAKRILEALINNGARMAKAGEFTMRAFMNGRIDLSQAESIADLIASENEAARKMALNQLKGGISQEISILRNDLLNFTSLIELELDFSEEDVEFADRSALNQLLQNLKTKLQSLIDSFQYGNAMKNGIDVAIIGKPNAGKSTLLNALLKEERAIVSDIAGTTRDTIEEVLHIKGTAFRFIDTAGIRETVDKIEEIGVKKAKEKISTAKILLYLYDEFDSTAEEVISFIKEIYREDLKVILLHNKIDKLVDREEPTLNSFDAQLKAELVPYYTDTIMGISARDNINIELLKAELANYVEELKTEENAVVITNQRHYEALQKSFNSVQKVEEAVSMGIQTELLAYELRTALEHLGEISGEFTNDEVLGNIFSKFCIGK